MTRFTLRDERNLLLGEMTQKPPIKPLSQLYPLEPLHEALIASSGLETMQLSPAFISQNAGSTSEHLQGIPQLTLLVLEEVMGQKEVDPLYDRLQGHLGLAELKLEEYIQVHSSDPSRASMRMSVVLEQVMLSPAWIVLKADDSKEGITMSSSINQITLRSMK